MVAAGHEGHREPWDAVWGQRYASLRDPDGTGVDLYAAAHDGLTRVPQSPTSLHAHRMRLMPWMKPLCSMSGSP